MSQTSENTNAIFLDIEKLKEICDNYVRNDDGNVIVGVCKNCVKITITNDQSDDVGKCSKCCEFFCELCHSKCFSRYMEAILEYEGPGLREFTCNSCFRDEDMKYSVKHSLFY